MLKRFGSLRSQIILLILFAMLPAMVLSVYSDFEQRRLAVSESKSDILATLRLMVTEERHEAEATQQILIALTHHLRLSDQGPGLLSVSLRQPVAQYLQGKLSMNTQL